MPPDQIIVMPAWAVVILQWFKGQPVFGGLLLLMLLDIGTGLCLSIIKKTLSSTVSWRGMSRKVSMLLVVGLSMVLQVIIPSFPFVNVVSFFYTLSEAISVLENAAASGVPLPYGFVDVLVKLRDQQRLISAQKLPTSQGNNTINNTIVVPGVPSESRRIVTEEEANLTK